MEFSVCTPPGNGKWTHEGRSYWAHLQGSNGDRKLMAASVKARSTFEFNAPKPLFETHTHEPLTAEELFTYDVSADGQRFLINANWEQTDPRPVDIILNWTSQLKR